ncbi:hypothetical protein AK88_02271 [Plasmodium fragile]|uniref:Uncharacterized protein n=1 Tax=Plasmodium fragile TaxID=5857 RepID=A0A0D9QQM7_PLAFR|nr:uncharacterized protein AK88_02271 [Plasmodium fragile]KJP87996.1 hypothetical protein AK88_02271 [Plasmodium fragile]
MQPQNNKPTEQMNPQDTTMLEPFKAEHCHCGHNTTDNSRHKVNFTPCAAGESGIGPNAVFTSQESARNMLNLGILKNSDRSIHEKTLCQCHCLIGDSNEEAPSGYSPNTNGQNSTLNRSKEMVNKSGAINKSTQMNNQREILSEDNFISSDSVSQENEKTDNSSFNRGKCIPLPVFDA